jgi:hypothetical protein
MNNHARFVLKLDEYLGIQYWRASLRSLKQNAEVCRPWPQWNFSREKRDGERR